MNNHPGFHTCKKILFRFKNTVAQVQIKVGLGLTIQKHGYPVDIDLKIPVANHNEPN